MRRYARRESDKVVDLSGLKPRKLASDGNVFGFSGGRKVVAAITSWTARIDQVHLAVEGFLSGTVVPDAVFVSLSVEEFPGRESDLPESLLCLSRNPVVRINWVEGPNTKPWKKVFPILQFLNDDDLILMVDDDCIIDPKLVETRIREFDAQNGRFAISGGGCYKRTHLNIPLLDGYVYNTICPTSLVQKRMLRGWERFMSDDGVVSTYHDDCLYSLLCLMNGFRIVPSEGIHISRDPKLEVEGMHPSGVCMDDRAAIERIVRAYESTSGFKFVDRLFNLVIWDSFNLAGDNGEYLYRRIRELYPDINMTFVLSRTSSDWYRLDADGFNLYPFEGDKFEFLLQNATWILWSKQPSYFVGDVRFSVESTLAKYRDKSVFLQHGVTSEISTPRWYFNKVLVNESKYMVSTSDSESNLIERLGNGGIVPVETGFPRWDFLLRNKILHDSRVQDSKKQILVSFHWRAGNRLKDESLFVESEYLKGINGFLNSPELRELVDSGVKVVFKPHAMFMHYRRHFKVPEYIFDPEPGKSFQDMLIESDLLITDVSSNMFEMAYIDRPSISWFPDADVVGSTNGDYHPEARKKYGNMFCCRTHGEIVETARRLLFPDGQPFHVPFTVFKHHDMDNSRRLVEWLLSRREMI